VVAYYIVYYFTASDHSRPYNDHVKDILIVISSIAAYLLGYGNNEKRDEKWAAAGTAKYTARERSNYTNPSSRRTMRTPSTMFASFFWAMVRAVCEKPQSGVT